MIAHAAIYGSAHRVNHKAARHCFPFDSYVQFAYRIEWRLGGTVLHQLDAPKKSTPADITNVRMITPCLTHQMLQELTPRAHLRDELVSLKNLLHSQSGSTGDSMSKIGVPVLEKAGALSHGFYNLCLRQNGPDGLVTAA